jgi:hypothetical protein
MSNRRIVGWALGILLAGAWWGMAGAQDGGSSGEDMLVLRRVDEERPVLFQALAPGDDPIPGNFEPRLEVPLADEPETPVIYIAIDNRGWSVGAVGLIGAALDPDEEYIALELWERMGNLVVRDDGHGNMFPLVYMDDLDGDETSGFRLDVTIDQGRMFRVYRVVETGGLSIWGQTAVWDGALADTSRVSYRVTPQPVFGDLLLDFHIVALPRRLPTPTQTPARHLSRVRAPGGEKHLGDEQFTV